MDDYLSVNEDPPYYNYINFSCEDNIVPPSAEYITSLGIFGAIFVSIGTILTMSTIVLTGITCYQVLLQRERMEYKKNCLIVLSIYPIASICSLVALSIPRTQLLSDSVTQIALTISMYRLYLLIIDIGTRKVTKIITTAMAMSTTTTAATTATTTMPMLLRVGPCCCWPCLPFPNLQLNDANLSWLQIIVLQFPIVQAILYIISLVMYMENPMIYVKNQIYLLPLNIISILFALYGLNIAFMSLKEVNPEAKLRLKAVVTQLVLLFSNFQAAIIRILPATGLFPCNPPITPIIYANFTYNALMLIEMLLLCYAARYLYTDDHDYDKQQLQQRHNVELPPIAMINVQCHQQNTVKTGLSLDINNDNRFQNNVNNNNNNDSENSHVSIGRENMAVA